MVYIRYWYRQWNPRHQIDRRKTWSPAPSIFTTPLSWWKKYVPNHEKNQWAPDISYYNGRYWLYYAVSAFGSNTSAVGLASTDRISSGNWRDDGLVTRTTTSNNYNAIDPELVIDKEGNPWLSFGSFWSGIKLTKLEKNDETYREGLFDRIKAEPWRSG